MIRGWYTAWVVCSLKQNNLDVIANNLANVDTTSLNGTCRWVKIFPSFYYAEQMMTGVLKILLAHKMSHRLSESLGLAWKRTRFLQNLSKARWNRPHHRLILPWGKRLFLCWNPARGAIHSQREFYRRRRRLSMTKFKGFPGKQAKTAEFFARHGIYGTTRWRYLRPTHQWFGSGRGLCRSAENRWIWKWTIFDKKGSSFYLNNELSGSAISAEGPARGVVIQGYVEASNVNVVNETPVW